MFEEIFTNQGFNHITWNILINLDVKSLWQCRLVCKGLHQSIKLLEKSIKLKENDFKLIRRIRWKKFLAHPNWIAAFNSICEEDNFYRRRGLVDLLETYNKQEKILQYDGPIIDSYLNLIYGTLKRLKFFWPYLSNKNPKITKDTPFHFVAYHGLSEVADFMVEEIGDDCLTRNESSRNGWSVLYTVSRNGHAEIIRSLRRKINFEFINQYVFKESLHVAIEYGHLDCVKALLEKETSCFRKNLCKELAFGGSYHNMNAVDIAKHCYSKTKYQNHGQILRYLSTDNRTEGFSVKFLTWICSFGLFGSSGPFGQSRHQ